MSSVLLLFMVLNSSTDSIVSHLVFITILQRFFFKPLVAVENFLLFSLGVFPPTSSADSKTTLVRLSFMLSTSPFTSSYSCEYLFWILIANLSDFSLTVGIFDIFILNNFSLSL